MENGNDSRERELMKAYVSARNKDERLAAEKSEAYKEMLSAQNKLVEFLTDMNKKSTGTYEDLGSVLITEPIFSIKVDPEHKDDQFQYLKECGAEAIIKETVHHKTFSSFIREKVEAGQQVPEWITISYIPQVKYASPKG